MGRVADTLKIALSFTEGVVEVGLTAKMVVCVH